MDRSLTWFIRVWIAFAITVNLAAVAGIVLVVTGEDFWSAWQWIAETYSPFNLITYVMELVLLLPAIGAYVLRERRRARHPAM
jgi:hypothetical protein